MIKRCHSIADYVCWTLFRSHARVKLVCISGSALSTKPVRDPGPSMLLFCHPLRCCPFFAMSELHCYNSFIWKLQKWRRKGVSGQGNQCLNPSLLLTSHCLKHSHLAKCSYKEGRKFASVFVSHVPCLNFTKMHGGEWILWEWASSQPHQGNSEGFAK